MVERRIYEEELLKMELEWRSTTQPHTPTLCDWV
jgi:hypothetical protein